MRNSRGGLVDIPSLGKAGAPRASPQSPRVTARGQVCGPKGRPFRQRGDCGLSGSAMMRSCSQTRRTTPRSPRLPRPLQPGSACDVRERPAPRTADPSQLPACARERTSSIVRRIRQREAVHNHNSWPTRQMFFSARIIWHQYKLLVSEPALLVGGGFCMGSLALFLPAMNTAWSPVWSCRSTAG
jgi:hypothetical protein